MKEFKRRIKRTLTDTYKTILLCKYYSLRGQRAKNIDHMVVYMADGRILHGGLSDRLCGIVSAYKYCKDNNYQFKINFINPYNIKDILTPNNYDWVIAPEAISSNCIDVDVRYLSYYSTIPAIVRHHSKWWLFSKKKQLQLYTNTRYFEINEFGTLFRELFKPTVGLQKYLDEEKSKLPNAYVSTTFRFQQLLGDFKEDGFALINDDDKKESLIQKCLNFIERIHSEKGKDVLVTSDSSTFLKRAKELQFVHTIDGKIRHMDFSKDQNFDIMVDMKSYADLFLLSDADEVFLCMYEPLYHSTFAKTAAMIGGKPYFEIFE